MNDLVTPKIVLELQGAVKSAPIRFLGTFLPSDGQASAMPCLPFSMSTFYSVSESDAHSIFAPRVKNDWQIE